MRMIPAVEASVPPGKRRVGGNTGGATGEVVWIAIRRKLGITPPNERFE